MRNLHAFLKKPVFFKIQTTNIKCNKACEAISYFLGDDVCVNSMRDITNNRQMLRYAALATVI